MDESGVATRARWGPQDTAGMVKLKMEMELLRATKRSEMPPTVEATVGGQTEQERQEVKSKKTFIVGITRSSWVQPAAIINGLHLTSHLIRHDFLAQCAVEAPLQHIDPQAPYRSIVFNGRGGHEPLTTRSTFYATFDDDHFIFQLDLLNAQGIDQTVVVYLLIRGFEGLTCAPTTWERFAIRWPNVEFRAIFAVQPYYVLHRDDHRDEIQIPLSTWFTPLSPLSLYYTRDFNVQRLAQVEAHAIAPGVHPDYYEILKWMHEAWMGRTRTLLQYDADLLHRRDMGRNAVQLQ